MHILFELQFFLFRLDDNEEKFEGKVMKTTPSAKQTKQEHTTSVRICHR